MKIISLAASNFARLRAVEIRPTTPVVPIVGKNDQGKSSVLKAIWTALEGRTAAPPQPIHEGAEEAVIKLDIGSLRITRKFGRGKHGELTSELSVVDEDGGKVRRTPQAVIDALLGDLSFDPLAFARLAPADQFERLKALVPGVDFDALAARRKKLYDERTEQNRKAKEQAIIAERILLPPGGEPVAVDVTAALAELSKANASNAARGRFLILASEQKALADRLLDEAEELRSRAAKLEAQAAAALTAAEAPVPAEVDVGPLNERIASARKVDEVRALFASKRAHVEASTGAQAASELLTEGIEGIDAEVAAAIAAAKLPAGITLDTETRAVHLRGLPFASAGTASRIIASAEVAMALNPHLRVMLIDEGSELDRDSMALLEELAEQRDFQIWVCSVDSAEAGPGFVIIDGTSSVHRAAPLGSGPGVITDAVVDRSKRRTP